MTKYLLLLGLAMSAFGASAGEDISFTTVDSNSDGFVSEREFVSWKTSMGDTSPADALIQFIEIDADASGMISEAEMESALAKKATEESQESDHMGGQL